MGSREAGGEFDGVRLVGGLISGCTERFRGRIATEVIQGLAGLSAGARDRLKTALDECVEVKGFRRGHASQSPSPVLALALRDQLRMPLRTLAPAVLRAWLELKGPTLSEARVLLKEGGFPICDPAPYPEFAEGSTLELVFDWMKGRLSGRNEDEEDDLLLAAFCLTQWRASTRDDSAFGAPTDLPGGEQRATAPQELPGEGQEVEMPHTPDADYLAPFRGLSPEAPFWDRIDEFFERLLSLRAEKLDERLTTVLRLEDTARRGQLETSIRRLREDHADTLEYLEVSVPDHRDLVSLDRNSVASALALLIELTEALEETRGVRATPSRTRQEDSQRQQDLGRLHARVAALVQRFTGTLGAAVPPEPAHPVEEHPPSPEKPGSPAMEPVSRPVEPVSPPAEPLLLLTNRAVPQTLEPILPTAEPALPTQEPALPTEGPPLPTEEPALPAEVPALPAEEPLVPVQEPVVAPEQTVPHPADQSARAPEQATEARLAAHPEPELDGAPPTVDASEEPGKWRGPGQDPPAADVSRVFQLPSAAPMNAWSDEQLTRELARVVRAGGNARPLGLLEELQLRWLSRGMNLRAWVLASWAQENPSAPPSPPIPPWLCWLAVQMSDDGAAGLALPPEKYVNQLLSQPWSDVRRVRFLIGWLAFGLLGENFAKAMAVAQVLPEGVGEEIAFPSESGGEFLLRRIVGPARRGQRPLSQVVTSKSELETRVREALVEAEGRRQLSERQFMNLKVKRFWFNLSGPGGPMATLLERVRSGAEIDIPPVDRFASKVDGAGEIFGKYRNAIDHRLEEFLRSLRVATAALAELRNLEQPSSTIVTPDDLRVAASAIQGAIPTLERERCPSVNAYKRLSARLASMTNARGER